MARANVCNSCARVAFALGAVAHGVRDKLTAALDKMFGSADRQRKAKQLSAELRVIRGDAGKVFFKHNEASTRK
jgi:tripartite-type tricarboxylate transporter receptor subunit TctC